jgi:hypothetical protein
MGVTERTSVFLPGSYTVEQRVREVVCEDGTSRLISELVNIVPMTHVGVTVTGASASSPAPTITWYLT